jgi:hypothetical protein
MSTEQTNVLIFKDSAGEYYLLPRDLLEQGRVPEAHKAEVERLLVEADGDVSGYIVAATYTFLQTLNAGATAIGDVVGDAAKAARVHRLLWGENA